MNTDNLYKLLSTYEVISDFIDKGSLFDVANQLKDKLPVTLPVKPPVNEYRIPEKNILVQNSIPGVSKAVPTISKYWHKFKNKKLGPRDVTGFAGSNNSTEDFQDISEITTDSNKHEDDRLFYGKGVEVDSSSMI